MSRKSALAAASPILVIAFTLGAGCVGEVSEPAATGNGTGPATGNSGKGGIAGTSGLTGSFGGNSAATAGTSGLATGTTGTAGTTGGTTGAAGMAGAGSGGSGGSCSGGTTSGLPSDVQTLLSNRCWSCHGTIPAQIGLPSLVTRANLMAPSRTDPSKTNAELAVTRMQSTSTPMPPAPATRATTTEITALSNWIAAGYPAGSCGGGTGGAAGNTGSGGAGGSGGSTGTGGVAGGSDPFTVAPKCTSMTMWTRGNQGSGSMNPGMACISCHSTGEGPRFTIAGTLYPTGHEPDRCNGVNATTGAQVVIIGADGRMLTLTPNSAGNFYSQTAVATPFQAKVVYMGRERVMIAKQTSGDCNSCHTQTGANAAPGRIALP